MFVKLLVKFGIDFHDLDYDMASLHQVLDTGHYCLPSDSDVNFLPLSKQIELEFLSLVTGRKVDNIIGNEEFKEYDKDHTNAVTEFGMYDLYNMFYTFC